MKRVIIFSLLVLLILPIAIAQSEESTLDEETEAGVTPDSFLWGIDKALENINLALTFDKSKKAEKRLLKARERLLEVKEMIEKNKIEDAEKAEKAHKKALEKVKIEIESLDEEDEEDLDDILEIEDELDKQENEIEEIKTKIKIKIKGQLTEEQKAKLQEFLDSLGENVERVRIEIKDKESRTLTKIEQRTGRQREEIIDELGRLRTDKKIKANILGDTSLVKIDLKFTTRTTNTKDIINEIIEKFAVSAEEANRFLKIEDDEDKDDENEERLRIKIDRKNDIIKVSKVKVELRFFNGIEKEAIVDEIVSKTQLTIDQINEVLEIKDRDKKDKKDDEDDHDHDDEDEEHEHDDDELDDEDEIDKNETDDIDDDDKNETEKDDNKTDSDNSGSGNNN